MTTAFALAGWTGAGAALVGMLSAARTLSARMEAVRRACHELRGPLTAARLGLELEGRRGTLPPPRLRAIDLELGRAALALDDLAWLDARRGRGRCAPALAVEPVDVAGLLADSVEAWRAAAERRGVELRLTWSGPRVAVYGDRLRLAQATGNLIANAIEHGAGPVELHGRLEDGAARIEVLDRGPGLSAPVAELVRRRRRESPRRGRGLTIASEVAAAHGGRLAAAPSATGARLVLELPALG